MDGIYDWWLNFFEHASFWNAFWPSVLGAVFGALMAFILERRYRRGERIRREIGQCNKLLFTLGQMLTILENINESLFEAARNKFGREPEWHEITGLVGTPERGPDFILGEFVFLLEYEKRESHIPDLLSAVYNAETTAGSRQRQPSDTAMVCIQREASRQSIRAWRTGRSQLRT